VGIVVLSVCAIVKRENVGEKARNVHNANPNKSHSLIGFQLGFRVISFRFVPSTIKRPINGIGELYLLLLFCRGSEISLVEASLSLCYYGW
jgi:hypothetical protein